MNIKITSSWLFFWSIISCCVFFYAFWYNANSYQDLVLWYQQLNPNFYKSDLWTDLFFTPDVKSFGQWYSGFLVLFCLMVLWLLYKNRNHSETRKIQFNIPKITTEGLSIFILVMLNWWFWQGKALYATDEVFSALNFADKPFFQTISHYPLPNNHILYNAINHWFRYISDDLVFSGRLLSGVFTALMMVNIYTFSENFTKSKVTRILIILLLMTVFPIMGFSTQARGYSLHLLLGWIAFAQLYYYSKTQEESKVIFYILVNALGMWTMPSYLYLWAGLTCGFCLKMMIDGKVNYRFVSSTLQIFVLVLILYLPVVTFSGWASILDNKYVALGQESTMTFIQSSFTSGYFQGLVNDFFGTGPYTWLGVVMILLSFILACLGRKKTDLGLYIFSLILVFLMMSIVLRKLPFYRNLVSHGLMIWYLSLILIVVLIEGRKRIYHHFLSFFLLTLVSYFTYTNFNRFPFHLYYYDVNGFGNSLATYDVSDFKDAKVFIHEESFFWHTPMKKITNDINLGSIIDQSADVIIIDQSRSSIIDTTLWTKHGELGESQLWKNKIY